MRTIYAGLCVLLIALGSMSVHAQFVPVTSNIRFTFEASKDGKVTRQVKEGVFYRTVDGSTLTHWTKGDLNALGNGASEFFDNKTLHTYEIFYDAKKMMELSQKLPAPHKPDDFKNWGKSVGTDAVEGIPCDLIAIDFAGPQIKPHRVGASCVSRDYGLVLKQETKDTSPDGRVIHTLQELYNIRLNLPPDNNVFDTLHTFTIVKAPMRPLPSMPN